jgi:hypothetical protein
VLLGDPGPERLISDKRAHHLRRCSTSSGCLRPMEAGCPDRVHRGTCRAPGVAGGDARRSKPQGPLGIGVLLPPPGHGGTWTCHD